MRRGISVVMVLALSATLAMGVGLYAQVKKDQASGLDRIEGTIQAVQKDKSTLSIQQSGRTSVWQVVYSAQTKFTMRNKPATVEAVKEGQRVIVLGKYDKDTLNAARIDIRTDR